MGDPRACVVIDYQNIHLTARDIFAPHGPRLKGVSLILLGSRSRYWPSGRLANATPRRNVRSWWR